MSQIGKSRLPADLGNISICLHKHPLGVHDPGHIDILDYRAVGIGFKFPAQVKGADKKAFCQVFHCNVFVIVLMNLAHNLNHPPLLLGLYRVVGPLLPGQTA